ncbi:hypothetical protein HBI56_071300 [Parastagonospora nodorum]|uniref:Transcription factor domain-containing protein n=2 Tax=Phaeosphaeria nodorum (strain SN15 / ATCC MYA-4574 / FGSC 10173) TaxID=321614 RepID=A0A7U2EP72_PHANO|nr:hypothetical protein SNOG_09853 [Parastagonospora nodorum SN15]KAH3920530.1 hypothetical protein HBH56_005750 [Parastagonospora nodorum]EAT83118.1 hypothetical protein SNOG_09853 [Parastagonospora nodorum SN15]KAH3938303.1 hypothetical protein HBH54_005740 [Parastagonospora nodorum]KAH3946684.1 hypothetical protein HBH53_126220 [Parastagonospora nodorum]KAH3975032.1 hypothetical protein HBH51_088470 [Parastagonospora nodorum]
MHHLPHRSPSMTDGPPAKKRRIEQNACGPAPVVIENFGFENIDPFHSPATASSWPFDEFAHDPDYLASQEALRSLLFTTARSVAPTRAATPEDADESNGAFDIKQVLPQGRRVQYLKNYLSQVAPWLDMFDCKRTFGLQLPTLAKDSPPLFYAILAIGARQLERKVKMQSSFDSLELYQEAIRLLTPLLSARDTHVIAACVILCCLEMFSASAQDWRHHLEGCAAIFDAFSVNGFSDDVLQPVFWCYARMDVCGALISDGTQSTLLKPAQWLPSDVAEDDAESLFRSHSSPDMYANYAVYLCAKTCELISDRNKYVELGTDNGCDEKQFHHRWNQLWGQLSEWALGRPKELLPVDTYNAAPFPKILFAHWAAISSNQLYHTSSVLLLTARSKPALAKSPEASLMWHVKRICGISVTNPHEGCLNNAIQPLWIAGRHLSHSSEQVLVVKTIRRIEALTGWTATWRIRDLERTWGYKVPVEG